MTGWCSASIIRDFDLAEDATQEAFVQAFRDLPMLRELPAFPGWLRRIVFKHCDRLIRRKRVPTVPLDEATEVAVDALDPAQIVEAREGQAIVLSVIGALPDREREVTLLYYLGEYSQQEIADFLQVPLTTVNNRLHGARKRLKGRMMDMVKKTLKAYRLPEDFRVVVGPASQSHSASPSLAWFRDRWVLAWQDGEAWEPYDGPFWFYLSESADARQWSEPVKVETLSTPKGSLTLTAAMSPDSRLVIAQDVRDEDGKSEIQVAISPDRGRSWPAKAAYAAGSLVDPAVAFAPDGALILAGSSRRESKIQPWVMHSRLQRL